MSREIKFRAWNNHGKWMGFVDELEWEQNSTAPRVRVRGKNVSAPHRQFELMQYTGLKDKNGVEIYEGDIVEWQDHKPSRQVHEVRWSNRSLWWSLYKNDTFYESLSRADIPRVIGNIYENPELLEDDNE